MDGQETFRQPTPIDSARARDLFFKYRAAVAYVAVQTPSGDESIGSAFHIGDGLWVTARHVVEENRVLSVATTGWSVANYGAKLKASGGSFESRELSHDGAYELTRAPQLHPDPRVDVAVLSLDGPRGQQGKEKPVGQPAPVVPLGGWLDDWLGDELTLESVLVMGYPPVPFGREPLLLASRAEVNGVVDRRDVSHPHFLLSATARGGLSGGLALVECEAALGVITNALVMDNAAPELGFLTVLSVEPIYDCLEYHGLLPASQALPGS